MKGRLLSVSTPPPPITHGPINCKNYGEKVRNVFEKFETDPEGKISAVYDQNFERFMVVESDLKLLSENKLDVSVVEPIYRKPLEILISKVEDIIEILPTELSAKLDSAVQRDRLRHRLHALATQKF